MSCFFVYFVVNIYMDIKKYLADAEAAGLKRKLKKITPISARECLLAGLDKPILDFSSNNYLGIADHPKLKEEAICWTEKFGTGSKASRLISGTLPEYIELEEKIAAWKGYSAAIIIGSGYMANTGIIPAIAGRKSAIFADRLNHASLNAGCQLSGAKLIRYPHKDLKILLDKLQNSENDDKIIVADTVFSMDGDVIDVNQIAKLAKDNNAILYLDDAHATGIFSDNGSGLAHDGNADIAMGTFSKAMGAYGAYAACSKAMKEYLVNRCGSFIYTTALPPGVYGAISAAVELVQTREFCEIRKCLLEKSANFAAEVMNLGYDTGKTATPIVPIIVGDSEEALRISQLMLDEGILAIAIRPPTVPKGTARLRISINAAHTEQDINRLLDCLKKAKRN